MILWSHTKCPNLKMIGQKLEIPERLTLNLRIKDGRLAAILNPNFTKIELAKDFIIIHNISKFEDDRTKIEDSRALTMNFRIQDGRQAAILIPIFKKIAPMYDLMVTHKMSKFEDDRTKIGDSRAFNVEFKNQRWPTSGHFESKFHENRTCQGFHHHTQYIQI